MTGARMSNKYSEPSSIANSRAVMSRLENLRACCVRSVPAIVVSFAGERELIPAEEAYERLLLEPAIGPPQEMRHCTRLDARQSIGTAWRFPVGFLEARVSRICA